MSKELDDLDIQIGSPLMELEMEALIASLRETHPELVAIMDAAKQGGLSKEEALQKMLGLMGGPLAVTTPEPPEDLGVLFDNGVGLPQINPLMQAAMAERLLLDGDLPELRTGDLPKDSRPAVPVTTTARNPVAVGLMLEQASRAVENEVRQNQRERALFVENLASGKVSMTDLLAKGAAGLQTLEGDPDFGAIAQGSQATDAAVYRRGEASAAVATSAPSGSALAALTPEERRAAAYKFLSTTQGRRSAEAIIRELVQVRLSGGGFDVREREFDPTRDGKVVVTHQWAVNIHGRGAIKATFNLIDTAAQALAGGILRQIPEDTTGQLWLEVTSMNTVDVRSVGWSARLVA